MRPRVLREYGISFGTLLDVVYIYISEVGGGEIFSDPTREIVSFRSSSRAARGVLLKRVTSFIKRISCVRVSI
jgi:hypothetical protein